MTDRKAYMKEYNKRYRDAHKEEKKAYMAKYRETHKEEIKAQRKKYNSENREKLLEYYRKYHKLHQEKEKAYRDSHKEETKIRRKKYYEEHKEESKEKNRQYNIKLRYTVLEHYGCRCVSCGETEPMYLCADHINNDGNEHRQIFKGNMYKWIIDNNYPDDFQILCRNCNWGKRVNNVRK